VDAEVPIEHTLLYATRWQEWNITTVSGSLLNNYSIVNEHSMPADAAFEATVRNLAAVTNITEVRTRTLREVEDGPYLVLLPSGSAGATAQLRYAYRVILRADAFHQTGAFIVWTDAQDGTLLQLEPLLDDVGGAGAAYNRDPGVGTSSDWKFTVDSSAGG